MLHLEAENWRLTPDGEARGYIEPRGIKELWFHTGTNCNLRCPFCLEGSRPGDNRLEFITLEDFRPLADEAITLGVERFSFTGGEPFVNPAMVEILDYALAHRPCLVLTNATEPLMNQLRTVLPLRDRPQPLTFRVSLDSPDPDVHDAGRGRGSFQKSLRTLRHLAEAGFGLTVARLRGDDETDTTVVDRRYSEWFREAGLPGDTRIVAFPDFKAPGAIAEVPHITEDCMTRYLTADQRAGFMCSFSKMVVRQNGRVGIYACTLVDDDPDYNLGGTLAEALRWRVQMKHHRCYSCFAYGASCSEA
jgi:sulfatase maturation enzyme AslB (radical SAM superfamily)